MKKNLIVILFISLLNLELKAQTYVTIPDAIFVSWLQTNYPNCMNGNQMNIDCFEIQNEDTAYIVDLGVNNLSGIEYFTSLTHFSCAFNQISSLPTLPNTLVSLFCFDNLLTSLPNLPDGITELYCMNNQISNIASLPSNLVTLLCFNNQLTNLPNLPDGLVELSCYNNILSTLPTLPNSLTILRCGNNQLSSLPALPNSLNRLWCDENQLTNLSALPNGLTDLFCSGNQISTISNLPDSLITFFCSNNQLSNLPTLPIRLDEVDCSYNQLLSLPNLPDNINYLDCSSNNISCLPELPITLEYLFFYDNLVTCLPNYIATMEISTLEIPLCGENDLVNNPNGCASSNGIKGNIYHDNNSDCYYNVGDDGIKNIPIKIYDPNDSLIAYINSFFNGTYQFVQNEDVYNLKVDTINLPFTQQCPSNELDTIITLDIQNITANNVNFAISCKPGFDIGIKSIVTNGWVFPGLHHELKIVAGDLSQFYNMNCAASTSGQVQISISGPVTYQTNVAGTLTPTINGNTFTYDISDFGTTDIFNSFGLIFQTDTTAQAGDQICVNVSVTPELGDNNPSNNSYEFCYSVVNSYDPNMKEVYPVNVEPGFEDYFTYTIHFQNTGNAPAMNIRLLDTLDANLDLETFQIINYSHYQTANVRNNILTFHFPNIQLPDSTSNPDGSKGYVQYRIKPKANLTLGTKIHNTANIYFDYNEPIVTNTTINEYVTFENSLSETTKSKVKIYPNPFSSSTTIKFDKTMHNVDLILYNIYGQQVKQELNFSGDKYVLKRENFSSGAYFLEIKSAANSQRMKLIIKD